MPATTDNSLDEEEYEGGDLGIERADPRFTPVSSHKLPARK
jgi:hypothetical protein